MEEESSRPIRLMNFLSEEQLDEAKMARGERVEDGTAHRDRPLCEILKENKDKKDADSTSVLSIMRPPKALDEDETEFLDNLEMSRREYEQQIADDEAEQLRSFQAAVAAQSAIVRELKDKPPTLAVQEQRTVGKKNPPARPFNMMIKVKLQVKKAKLYQENAERFAELAEPSDIITEKTPDPVEIPKSDVKSHGNFAKTCLISYSDESEEDG